MQLNGEIIVFSTNGHPHEKVNKLSIYLTPFTKKES